MEKTIFPKIFDHMISTAYTYICSAAIIKNTIVWHRVLFYDLF